ncbi:hypothetical protein V9T40_009026 [Parthenolecanium corni]|uniref:Cuticle protein n=1 Tax=Parthenolecanium corni TaxID=536013 RepID=A0AAN9TRS5_9HEMI
MTVIGVISAKIDGWDTSPNTQYHIQTDEGPERFFRYQTISGQYRKEKRLQDGTVIGSYGWVDADGYLRLNDYVADNNGYRVLRTKRLFVGPQTPIDSALDSSRYVPPQAGTDVTSSPTFRDSTGSSFRDTTGSTFSDTTGSTYAYPEDKSKFLLFPSSSPSPIAIVPKRRPTPPAGYYPTSTPPSIVSTTAAAPVAEVAITPHYYVPAAKSSYPSKYSYKTPLYTTVIKARPDYTQNSVNSYFGDRVHSAGRKSYDEAPNYDGVSVTRNGFRYYLPRQYHEEENSSGDERVGSFGYIDPFGIRRVIYYNASPSTGFVHRKNNRYVGFDATPYDPRP